MNNYLLLTLPISKTDKGNEGVIIPVARIGEPLCAYDYVRRLFDSRLYVLKALLFTTIKGIFLRQIVIAVMQRRIAALGTPSYNYLGHSFRKGAAKAAIAAGVTKEKCKILG